MGASTTFDYRKQIAAKNGISNYTGTSSQNTKLLNLLKQGKLIKPWWVFSIKFCYIYKFV